MKKVILFLLLPLLLFSYELDENLNLRGFATFDATINTSEQTVATYLPNGQHDNLYHNQTNFNYSNLGLQLDWEIYDSIDLMTQAIYVKNEEDGEYEVELPWLMLGYSFGDGYKLRAGKMKVPFMKGTETRNINYSFLWTRPQILHSGVNGFDTLYGIDLLKKTYIDEVDLEFQLTAGQAEHQLEVDENNYLYSASALASYENSWIRASFGQTSFDKINPRTDEMIAEDEIITFISVETQVSLDSWLIQAGYADAKNDIIPDTNYIYGSLAYEFDEITPYFLYSKMNVEGLPLGGPPPNMTTDGFLIDQSHAVGLRYDFYNNIALKLQYEYKLFELQRRDVIQDETNYNIYTITLDTVF